MAVNEIMFLDLEVQNHPYYGALASPRHPENFVVMNGFAVENTPYAGEVQYDHYTDQSKVPGQWLNISDDVWLIVMHNAPFEMDWFLKQQRPQIMKFLKRGGRIYDTAYAEYLLSHQLNTYPSLDETAPNYGGSHKVDGIKILWDQGVLTSAIDPALLAKYLTSNTPGEEGDVANTRLIFYGQYQKLVEQGMFNMFLERMEGLIYNCFAMDSGLYVDRDIAMKQRAEGEGKLVELAQGFAHYQSHIPEYVKFNPGSDFHMSAWLFGGPIKYVGKELATTAEGVQKWVKADFVKAMDGTLYTLLETGKVDYGDKGMTPEVMDFDNPLEKYKAGKNKGTIKVFREDTDEPMMRNTDMLFTVAPLVDLTLLPQNLYKEFKKEFAGKRKLADESPVFSTGKDALDMLSLRKEFPEHVRKVLTDLKEWARIDKDMSTYYLRAEYDDAGSERQDKLLQQYVPGTESREVCTVGLREKYEAEVRVDAGSLEGYAGCSADVLSDMRQADVSRQEGPAWTASSTGPLPPNGQGSGSAVPHMQQGVGDVRGQLGGYHALREIPQVGEHGCVKVSGMLQYLTPSGYVHHLLNATATITTRLSSNRPNFQNLPRGGTSDVKKMFVSRFGADGFIMEADYSALEVVTLAAFSKDIALTRALLDGIDMHCMRLSAQLNEPYADVLLKCKDENHPEHQRYSEMRTDIKPKAFSYQYGATAHGIAFSTGCTVEEAQLFIDTEKALFPEVEAWFNEVVFPEVERTGVMHREQADDGSWRLYNRGTWTSVAGTRYSFRQYEKREWSHGQSAVTMQYKPTQMRNYPIQGESGFFVQGIAGLVVRWLIANDFFPDAQGNPRVYIINQVHDALYFDVHKDVLDVLGAGVKQIMESLPQYFNAKHGYDLQVPFPAAVEFGRSMHEKIGWHHGVLDNPKVREKLGWQLPLAA